MGYQVQNQATLTINISSTKLFPEPLRHGCIYSTIINEFPNSQITFVKLMFSTIGLSYSKQKPTVPLRMELQTTCLVSDEIFQTNQTLT